MTVIKNNITVRLFFYQKQQNHHGIASLKNVQKIQKKWEKKNEIQAMEQNYTVAVLLACL